ncbi:Ribosomal_protein S26 [Hexamita inflata]|uniref:40S ribosomal protein S26 n=1 Tax=Hexamita inflata TaxID=28002 RepID=A0AA86RQG1_9EUKA|nr:Ribosomal protein S26 [Hexamita inflata]CAI9969483.1 Ribosomal protein S26 [Hexamita inflata]CAI9976144.1 Ribosomal protein S26 [Hexamita inflata]
MPVKRRNHGRCKNHAGRTVPAHCHNCYRLVPVDKITRRFNIKQMIESNIQQDVLAACVVTDYVLPKLYTKIQYCVSCAIHNHLVHVRSHEERLPKPVSLDRFKRVAAKKVAKPVVEKKVEEKKE